MYFVVSFSKMQSIVEPPSAHGYARQVLGIPEGSLLQRALLYQSTMDYTGPVKADL
jgi:hypothetical protein